MLSYPICLSTRNELSWIEDEASINMSAAETQRRAEDYKQIMLN